MKTMKVDRIAAGHLLDTFTDTTPEMLAALTMPTLVVCGEQDQDHGSAEELVAAFPEARLETLPATHMSSVLEPDLGGAIPASTTAYHCLPRAPNFTPRAPYPSPANHSPHPRRPCSLQLHF